MHEKGPNKGRASGQSFFMMTFKKLRKFSY